MNRVVLFLLLCASVGFAQPGSIDPTFHPSAHLYGDGPNGLVSSVLLLADGKVVLAGNFLTYNGITCNRLTRVNADGSHDATFITGSGANGIISRVIEQTDGKLLIVGSFTTYDGTSRNRIARLNSDGSLDTTFNPGLGVNNEIFCVVLQTDGKILIGGAFSSYNGTAAQRIARLNPDASLDTSFSPGTGNSGTVYSIALQPDGKLIVGAFALQIGSMVGFPLTRMNTDGSQDPTFTPGTAATGIFDIKILGSGKIVVGGSFNTYNGTSRRNIARINSNGTLDTSFIVGTGTNGTIRALEVQPDDKILIGGEFTTFGSTSRNGIARLNANGSLDTGFDPGSGTDIVYDIALQPDDKILVSGLYEVYGDDTRKNMSRVNSDGSLDQTFNPLQGPEGSIISLHVQPDDNIIIAGTTWSYDATIRPTIARLDPEGYLDPTFDAGTGASGYINTTAWNSGKTIAAGVFNSFNGLTRNNLVQLNSDGSVDTSFIPATPSAFYISKVIVQPDGKILACGYINGSGISAYLVRLNSNGSTDVSFTPASIPNQFFFDMALQPDGKIIVGGSFTSFNSSVASRVMRLNTNGSFDASFNTASGPSGQVQSIAVQPDGMVVVAGNFTTVSGITKKYIARLDANGTLDTAFNTGVGPDAGIDEIKLQPDGKIVVSGFFQTYDSVSQSYLARINTDGSLDSSFDTGTGPDSQLSSIGFQSDEKIIISGLFSSYDGAVQKGIARLFTSEDILPCPTIENPSQTFCSNQNATIDNLDATDNGGGVVWYDAIDATVALSPGTPLIDGSAYFADNTSGSCDVRESVTVTIQQEYSFYVDADSDGFGSVTTALLCAPDALTPPSGYTNVSGDCDDAVAAINPGHAEVLYNGVDDNCDGNLDEGFQLLSNVITA
ncbi:MopE-related protein, partial [Flavobacterium silvaticum]